MRRIRFYSGFFKTLFCNSSFMLDLLAPYRLKHKGAIPAIHIAMALANNLNRLLLLIHGLILSYSPVSDSLLLPPIPYIYLLFDC